jgi:DNA-binding transcriptional MocR family regulator
MTPADEALFVTLWQQGVSYRELAAALGCPLGTVASRSAALVAQGKIQPRPRGGAYPSRRAKARPEDPPAPPAPPRHPPHPHRR